jgi:hypothetical protein
VSSQRPHRARLAVPAVTTLALVLGGPASAAWAGPDDKGSDTGARGLQGSGASQGKGGTGSGDPAGNNGTVKIDGVPLGDGRGNEPHVDCAFALDFYGFDASQTADITFTGKAPTGAGTLLTQKGVAISDDAAGGGQDRDAVLTYTAEQLGLTGTAPHRNGWHVKVAVDVLEAPGGAKQKVFWLDCDRPEGTAGTTTDTTTDITSTGSTTDTTSTGTPSTGTISTGTTSTGTTSTGTTVVEDGTAGTGAGTATGVAGIFGEAAVVGGTVRGASISAATLPAADAGAGALPTTGGELAMLVLLGLTAIGVGTAGVLAGRSSRATQPA